MNTFLLILTLASSSGSAVATIEVKDEQNCKRIGSDWTMMTASLLPRVDLRNVEYICTPLIKEGK